METHTLAPNGSDKNDDIASAWNRYIGATNPPARMSHMQNSGPFSASVPGAGSTVPDTNANVAMEIGSRGEASHAAPQTKSDEDVLVSRASLMEVCRQVGVSLDEIDDKMLETIEETISIMIDAMIDDLVKIAAGTPSKTVTPEIARMVIRKMGVDIPGVHFPSTAERPVVSVVKAPPRRRRARVPVVLHIKVHADHDHGGHNNEAPNLEDPEGKAQESGVSDNNPQVSAPST